MSTPRGLFFTAIHEAGHGWMALRDDPDQEVRLDLLTKGDSHEGWCESEWSTPRQLMAGMAAELEFGVGWHEAMLGSSGDRKNLREHFADSDWRASLREATRLIDRRRHEVAAIAVLLFQYRTLSQDECWECMVDPRRALVEHASRLEAVRLMDESIAAEIPTEPWYRELTLDGLPEVVARTISDVTWLWRG